jgi:hypothetical protein
MAGLKQNPQSFTLDPMLLILLSNYESRGFGLGITPLISMYYNLANKRNAL